MIRYVLLCSVSYDTKYPRGNRVSRLLIYSSICPSIWLYSALGTAGVSNIARRKQIESQIMPADRIAQPRCPPRLGGDLNDRPIANHRRFCRASERSILPFSVFLSLSYPPDRSITLDYRFAWGSSSNE